MGYEDFQDVRYESPEQIKIANPVLCAKLIPGIIDQGNLMTVGLIYSITA
jgi:hypothetical protein